MHAFGLIYLSFLVFTPGFGVQYLSWVVATGIFLGLYGSFLYSITSGIFIFSVYTYWSRGFPWYNADSDIAGPWKGVSENLEVLAWCYMAVWLVVSLLDIFFLSLLRKKPQ